METIIVICLITIIVLLLQDKVVIHRQKSTESESLPDKKTDNDIMGKPKPVGRSEQSIDSPKDTIKENDPEVSKMGTVTYEQENDMPFPEEMPPDIRDELPDPPEQWDSFEYPEVHEDFSTAVTYDEINTVARVLKQPGLPDDSAQQETVKVVEKIKDTELFALLEDGIEGASVKIAQLLDRNLPSTKTSSVRKNKNELDNFDIGEFV